MRLLSGMVQLFEVFRTAQREEGNFARFSSDSLAMTLFKLLVKAREMSGFNYHGSMPSTYDVYPDKTMRLSRGAQCDRESPKAVQLFQMSQLRETESERSWSRVYTPSCTNSKSRSI